MPCTMPRRNAALQPCLFTRPRRTSPRPMASRDGCDAYSMQPGSFGAAGQGTDPSITPAALCASSHRPAPLQGAGNVRAGAKCTECGVAESAREIDTRGESNGLGAVGGAVLAAFSGTRSLSGLGRIGCKMSWPVRWAEPLQATRSKGRGNQPSVMTSPSALTTEPHDKRNEPAGMAKTSVARPIHSDFHCVI